MFTLGQCRRAGVEAIGRGAASQPRAIVAAAPTSFNVGHRTALLAFQMIALVTWTKLLHLGALLIWCASLFALPALFALYPAVRGSVERRRLWAGTRFTFIAVASPAAVIAVVTGTLLIYLTSAYSSWLFVKLALVTAMVMYHAGCAKMILVLHDTPRIWPTRVHVCVVAVPLLLVPPVLWLALSKPQFGM
ncbi:MAG: hypothetical protein EOO54_18285 [Haliea sp.]|nr:MAG: hypothetical protein EOO54_18285 [Haliea sp.]